MLNLKNEFIMPPLKLGYCNGPGGDVNSRHLDFYRERNRNIGAITPEPLYMDAGLRELPTQLGIDNDDKVQGLMELTSAIKENGAKAIAHLNHPGRMANPMIPGNYFWSATDKACENGGAKPEKMNREMMAKVIKMFIDSSLRAEKAGFDIIELQMGHGYLMAQFLSPSVNDRDDEFGGSFENRMSFPLEVVKSVVDIVSIPVIARISGDEIIPGGFHVQDMIQFSAFLEKAGIQALHVTAGSACSSPPWFFQHMFIPRGKTWEFASMIQEKVNIPVIYVGKINRPEDIDLLKAEKKASYMAIGRALVADPDFLEKYFNKGLIRPCLACAEGCLGGVKAGKGLACVVNPLVNTGLKKVKPVKDVKKYAVVGGGLAGMQASIILAERGHKLCLYEKDELGGQFNLAYLPPGKEDLKAIIDYFKAELELHKIDIIHKEARADDFINSDYDAVIMASGARPLIPPVKGLKEYFWTEFLNDDQLPEDKKIVIVGGGLIGMELASKLIEGNNHIIIVEMLDELARGMEMIEKAMTISRLKSKGVEIYLKHKLVEVDGRSLTMEDDEEQKKLEDIDHIVIATGMKSYIPFELSGDMPVYIIGDASKAGKAQEAIHDAYKLAVSL